MKPGQSPTGERFAPPPPPRQPRYPTAQRPTSHAPQSAGAPPTPAPRPQKSWDDFIHKGRSTSGTDPSTAFPGISRTQSTKKKQGFTPGTPGGDEPPAPRSSAYATYSRGERPHASTPQSYFPESPAYPSPQMPPQTPGRSPLRRNRSFSRVTEERQARKVETAARYSEKLRERTDAASASAAHISSSARNSPIDTKWHEREQNGTHASFAHDGPSRHRSSSPNLGPRHVEESSSSGSETSSDEDFEDAEWSTRPKATPQQPANGIFPGTKYVNPATVRETDSSRYQYRPPPPPRNQPTSQAAFNYVPSYSVPRATAQQPMSDVGNGYTRPEVPHIGPNGYAPFYFYPKEWSRSFRMGPSRLAPSRVGRSVPSLNGFPSWAVPSSVLPNPDTTKKHTLDKSRAERRDWIENRRSDALHSTFVQPCRKHAKFADSALTDSSLPDLDTTNPTRPPNQPSFQSASHEDVSKKFSASKWNDKLAGADDLFRPTSSELPGGRRSPVRRARSRAKSYSKSQTSPIKESSDPLSTSINNGDTERTTAAEAFVPSKFSDNWAEMLRYQAATAPHEDDRGKTMKRGFKMPAARFPPADTRPAFPSPGAVPSAAPADDSPNEPGQKANEDVDPMDIDDSFPSGVASTPSEATETANPLHPSTETNANPPAAQTPVLKPSHIPATTVNLDDLSNVSPLKPSDTGLGDLNDLHTTLPFDSKPSPARPSLHTPHPSVTVGTSLSSLKALNLPKPPKHVIIPPLENVTQQTWTRYISEMNAYMHDWNIFNRKVLDHFMARQAQLDLTLMPNWMSAVGDGPSGEEVSAAVQEASSRNDVSGVHHHQKAGYAAYRQWLDEDIVVRQWWIVACERHQKAVEELGRVRELAKPLAVGV
jgi:hypothetical protein